MRMSRILKQCYGWSFSALIVALLLAAPGAQAVTLNVVGGQLVGASLVNVSGSYYDVVFVDGTCIDLYNGCDEAGDFTFTTLGLANQASNALLTQVFVDSGAGNFDLDPELTAGCSNEDICIAFTPYSLLDVDTVNAGYAWNNAVEADDHITDASVLRTADLGVGGLNPIFTYAVWSPVPEPGTGLLMGLGLILMGARTRRTP